MKNQRKLKAPATILTLFALSLFLNACHSRNDIIGISGILDGPLPADSAPAAVSAAIARAETFQLYEIMADAADGITVEAIAEAGTTPTEGYGIVVTKGTSATTFPDFRNTRNPRASYDRQTGMLRLTCSAMEGTGVQLDWLHLIRFDNDGNAYATCTVNPYEIQKQLCGRLGYTIDGHEITFWDGEDKIVTVTNSITDMGGFDDEKPVWIGEQISYELDGPEPQVLVTPGVKFTTGLVLTYDDMPTLTAPLAISDDGTVNIGKLSSVL